MILGIKRLLWGAMKLSLAWMFDHIKSDWRQADLDAIVQQIGQTTAEIDGVVPCSWDWEQFFLGEVSHVLPDEIECMLTDRNKKIRLPFRGDAQVGSLLLIKREDSEHVWASLHDLGAAREGLVPVVSCPAELRAGGWRNTLESRDLILEIDNKSLTNRPDLWGHRGFAREVAALLGAELKSEEQLCAQIPVRYHERKNTIISLQPGSRCTRFALLPVSVNEGTPPPLWLVHRLARLDARSGNVLVDATNYVMFDLGHPLHAYDAQRLSLPFSARLAREGEKLRLLDGSEVTLNGSECVIADENGPVALGGIMGGETTAVSANTRELYVEAAHFDPVAIRRAAVTLKKRTESSARFEKGLDPNYNTTVLQRYAELLNRCDVPCKIAESITSVGPLAKPLSITIAHSFLVERLGASIAPSEVIAMLTRLGFGVQSVEDNDGLAYQLAVPSWRSYRDVRIPEDVVEEVGRLYGYGNIMPVLPQRMMQPFAINPVFRLRTLKSYCAYTLEMHETATYPLFHEPWLAELGYLVDEKTSVTVLNPLSTQDYRLVSTLIPNLLFAASNNRTQNDVLRFFECARIWTLNAEAQETKVCSGVLIDQRGNIDFYRVKEQLEVLFRLLNLLVEWKKEPGKEPEWADENEAAALYLGEHQLGWCAQIAPQYLKHACAGTGYAFELRTDLLISGECRTYRYEPTSKFQAVALDVSMFTPFALTVADLEAAIVQIDARVRDVTLIDRFEKAEWPDRRSLTMRYVLQDDEKTLTREEIDAIQHEVAKRMERLGAVVR